MSHPSQNNPRSRSDYLARRRELLDAEGLRYGAADARALFWARHNLQRSRRFRQPLTAVGLLTGQLIKHQSSGDAERIGRAIQAWSCVVPANCRGKCRVDGLFKGRLTVIVDSKSTGYVLRRQSYQALLDGMENQAPGLGIERIVFRVGRINRAMT